ncbi:MAG: radical SAM protein [Desulfatibacillaceae bacterium]
MAEHVPAYMALVESGELSRRVEKARAGMECCELCPRRCRVNRLEGELGVCRTGAEAVVSSAGPHFGEERPLVGTGGSGTIFFANCNLLCVFCQNFEISHGGEGRQMGADRIAGGMLELQEMGCHNVNFVTPGHVAPQILEAVEIAAAHGVRLPIVYNSSGYDSVETLKLLDGVVDIYMPDVKFLDSGIAKKACNAPDYPARVREAVVEMHRQVGDLALDENGVATRGLLVRHLVLPDGHAGTREVMEFLANEVSRDTYVNIMPQWRPMGDVDKVPELDKALSDSDFRQALQAAEDAGITRLDERRRTFLFR